MKRPITTTRTVLVDYRKAFDHIDHNILLKKMENLLPKFLLKWYASFLQGRSQSVKIGHHISKSVTLKGGVPQGALFGMEAFILMVNDLKSNIDIYKYVDDTTLSESFSRNENSQMQLSVSNLQQWSTTNNMMINPTKTKEMIIYFGKDKLNVPAITIDGNEIERVEEVKLVGIHITNNLKWNTHVDLMCKKASTKIYLLAHTKKSGVSSDDLLLLYKSCIRPLSEYACPVWSMSLPAYLVEKIERIQQRCLKIIFPNLKYDDAIKEARLTTLEERRLHLCKQFFNRLLNPSSRLNHLLPVQATVPLRSNRQYIPPHTNTERFKTSYINACLRKFQ